MTRARIYIRRSDDDQSAYSPEAQDRRLRDHCAARGHTIVEAYLDDDTSGKLELRGNLQRMLKDAAADPGSVVVVDKFDRLARDTELLLRTIYKTLLPKRVTVESVTESIDPYTPLGKMMLTVSGGVSTYYVDNLAQEVRKGLREKWERGGVVGNAPYGYRRVFEFDSQGARIPASDTLAPTDDAPIVLRLFTRYVSGAYSAAGLAEELNAQGYTHTGRGGARCAFTTDHVRAILSCPTYAGLTAYRGETRQGCHPAIIPPELWARAQEVRARRSAGQAGKSVVKSLSLLSDLAYCGNCGSKLHYHPVGAGAYYRCKARRAQGRDGCSAPMVRQGLVEAHLQAMLTALAIPQDIARDAIAAAEAMLATPPTAPVVDVDAIRARLKRLARAYADGGYSDEEYEAERARLEAMLAKAPPSVTRARLDLERASAVMQDAGSVYRSGGIVERRTLLVTLFDRLWLAEHQVVAIKPQPAYALLVEAQAGYVETPTLSGLETVVSIPPRWRALHTPLHS